MRATSISIALISLLALACGGSNKGGTNSAVKAEGDPGASYAALDVGADWKTYAKVNKASFESPTHGKRWVDIYVNPVGLAAYQSDAPFPVGTIIVKASLEAKDGKPTDVAGPLFVMQKREAGFAPEHEDWWYGLHWESVPAPWVSKMGASQVYWRSPSSKVDYCWGCHESYDKNVGMPPAEQRAWAAPQG